jgi:hypothetical protein
MEDLRIGYSFIHIRACPSQQVLKAEHVNDKRVHTKVKVKRMQIIAKKRERTVDTERF